MWWACQRASWEPRLPMRMGLRGLLCSELIVLTRIRDAKCSGSDTCHRCGSNGSQVPPLWSEWHDRDGGVDVVEWLWLVSKEWLWGNEAKLSGTNRTMGA